jgi:hypothetical protein
MIHSPLAPLWGEGLGVRGSQVARENIGQRRHAIHYFLHECIWISQDNSIREAQNPVPQPFQVVVTPPITRGPTRLAVYTAIQLQNQPALGAAKVDDDVADWVLAAEFEPLQPEASQQAPCCLLRLGFDSPEFAGYGDSCLKAIGFR